MLVFYIAIVPILLAIAIFVITQVLMPIANGTSLLPAFSKKAKLLQEIGIIEEKITEQTLQCVVDELNKGLAHKETPVTQPETKTETQPNGQ